MTVTPSLRQRHFFSCAALIILALTASACSPHRNIYPTLHALAGTQKYDQAVALVEKSKAEYSERNEVLYNMDRGLFLHYAGKYEESNKAFEEAERRIEDLFTESITGNVGAFLSNDNTLPYKGEDFESVVINIYRALNYAQLGSVEAALVEARKVDQKLRVINDAYAPEERNEYKEDAFARLLMGIFYELGGTRDDFNDAYISDKKAKEIYSEDFLRHYGVGAPSVLRSNLITTAQFMGPEELASAKKLYPGEFWLSLPEKRKVAQVFLVHFSGRGPVKVEDAIGGMMPDGNLIKIAFPRYQRRYSRITGSRTVVDGVPSARLEAAQPLGAIAIKNLENRKGRITAKAIARAATKYMANKALQRRAQDKKDVASALAFVAGNVYAVASEQADLRAWETLPDQILFGREFLEPGKHSLAVEFLDAAGTVVERRDLGTLTLAAGESRFVIFQTNH
ncbi:MAG: hypothetical protein OEW39_09965 [Deltaproteobacteria bacterium]|nr:hypothetical protein [Deltaproteobacteria bacterium]